MIKLLLKIIIFCIMFFLLLLIFVFFLTLQKVFEKISQFLFFCAFEIDAKILKKMVKLNDKVSDWVLKR